TRSVVVGDLNGDRLFDLAAVNYGSSTVSVLLNRGSRSFQAGLAYGTGDGRSQAAVEYGTAYGPFDLAIGDLNADGKLDLATSSQRGFVSVLLGNGGGELRAHRY